MQPILLIFDGHLSHLTAQAIELAIAENISRLKLPAHCTDVLQVLDAAVSNAAKSYYEKALTEHVHNTLASQPLTKALFTNLLAGAWHKGLSKANILSGFKFTYPVDHSKYKLVRIEKVKLYSYRLWKDAGSPRNEEVIQSYHLINPFQMILLMLT